MRYCGFFILNYYVHNRVSRFTRAENQEGMAIEEGWDRKRIAKRCQHEGKCVKRIAEGQIIWKERFIEG